MPKTTIQNFNKCAVRRMRIIEEGQMCVNQFIGTLVGSDALMDLHEGDIITTDMIFTTGKKHGRIQQFVTFHHVQKLNLW